MPAMPLVMPRVTPVIRTDIFAGTAAWGTLIQRVIRARGDIAAPNTGLGCVEHPHCYSDGRRDG